jgi:hypothetical protein
MSALFKPHRKTRAPQENWAKIAERRSSSIEARLRAGLFLRYQAATGAKEFDIFRRDAKTWALFEHAVLPELEGFTFFDRSREIYLSPSAALADGMFHLWTETDLDLDDERRLTTVSVVSEMATYLCALYEAKRIDKRDQGRNWFGFNPTR